MRIKPGLILSAGLFFRGLELLNSGGVQAVFEAFQRLTLEVNHEELTFRNLKPIYKSAATIRHLVCFQWISECTIQP